MKRLPSLDGVRAVAILLVMMGHWAEVRFHSDIAGAYASLGRRIFFVASGYLITLLLMKEYGKSSTIGLQKFYVRRAYRILPAATVFMIPVFVIFWDQLRWYQIAAAMLYLANFDFTHPWFIGHLWSISVQEQFYFLWPAVIGKWHQHRVPILLGVIAFAPVYRAVCHFAELHGRTDETFPAVADILAIGCLLALFEKRVPQIKSFFALLLVIPLVLVPIYMGLLRFHITVILLLLFWPLLHVSIALLLLHVTRHPYRVLNMRPMVWLGNISYSLYLWQQLFAFGKSPRPLYFVAFAVAFAAASYYIVEQPMLKVRERRSAALKEKRALAAAA